MGAVENCAVGCSGDDLDAALKQLNADGWQIRQIYQEPPANYRIFAQRGREPKPADDVAEATAISVVRANWNKPVRTIASALKSVGLTRGYGWISDQQAKAYADAPDEEQAVKYLKSHPEWEERDVVEDMRYALKITRSRAWVRLKRQEDVS